MKQLVDLAIIIPTLNEEHYIGKLLDSIEKQTVWPKEILVVDAESPDGTLAEIKKRQVVMKQLKYHQIPKYTIAKQRNVGVSKTTASFILFIDADMRFIDEDALEHLFREAVTRKTDFAIPQILPISDRKIDSYIYLLHNGIPRTVKPFKAAATTQCLFVTRKIFEKVGGFDEEIMVGEDFDLVSRMQKKGGKFAILKNSKIYSSVRRLEKDGRARYIFLLAISMLLIILVGYRRNPIQKRYEFGNHPKID